MPDRPFSSFLNRKAIFMWLGLNITVYIVKVKNKNGEKYKNSIWLDFRLGKETSVFQERRKAVIFK